MKTMSHDLLVQMAYYKLHCSFLKTPTTKTEIVRLIDALEIGE